MNKRNLKLDSYGISKARYTELRGFCEQYPEWKQELENQIYMRSMQVSDMPKEHNSNADNTSEMAIRLSTIISKCKIIEETATEADYSLSKYIIRNVCYGDSPTKLITKMEMPSQLNAFYDARRYFYYLLNKRRKN